MSVVTLKFVYAVTFWMLCLCFYSETCNAQSEKVSEVDDTKDSLKQYTTSQKKSIISEGASTRKRNESKVKQDVDSGKKDMKDLTDGFKSVTRKNKKNKGVKDKKNEATSFISQDTIIEKQKIKKELKDKTKSKLNGNFDGITKTVPDTLKKDSLKKEVADKFSKERIEGTLKQNAIIGDYKLDSFDKKKYNKEKQKGFLTNSKNKLAGSLGITETKLPGKEEIDSSKQIGKMIKKQLNANIKGSISLGYEYGILPYVAPDKYPTGGFKTEGRFSVMAIGLPIEVSYRYSTVKSVIGINNYFRVSYDVNRYKEELEKKAAIKDRLKKIQLDNLQLDKQNLAMKMENLKSLGNVNLPDLSIPDTSLNINGKFPLDLPNGLDSSKAFSYLKNKTNFLQKKDSILKFSNDCKAKYEKYKGKYDSISEAIEKLEGGIDAVKNFDPKSKLPGISYQSKLEEILKHIKKFEIGLCNPSYSLFLVSNAPLKGINLEYATKDHFFAVTYGTTVNTIFYNPNTLQGKLEGVKNFYTFFDYNDLSNGRKVLAVKGGKGEKEGTHLFAGILLGRGKMDYLIATDPKYGKKESNVVVELDAKYKFSEALNAEFIFGKSSLQTEDLSFEQLKKSFREIFSSYRSNAMQARINYDISKTKTKIQLTGRVIDPYFKSFGVSFLRSDNIRYEGKLEQGITKNIKYGLTLRREEDNLLGLLNYKNTFTTISNSLSIKLKKGLSIRLNYAPLLRTLKNGDNIITDRNSISTGIVSYVPKMKTVQASYNLLYSKYRITSDSGNIHFDNISYTHQFQFKSGFKTGMTASWFENTLKDTLSNNTYLGVVDIGYTTEKQNSFTLGGKVAYKAGIPTEYGFIAKATLRIYKAIFLETEAEKILTGDYYSSLVDSKIKQFPYFISSKVIINF